MLHFSFSSLVDTLHLCRSMNKCDIAWPGLYYTQVNEKFYKLERGYRDCIKRTRDKTRIYSIPHDSPGA